MKSNDSTTSGDNAWICDIMEAAPARAIAAVNMQTRSQNSKEKVSLRTDPLTPPYTTSTHVYHIQNSVQVISPSPLIKIEIVTKIYWEDQSNATTWVIMTDQPFFFFGAQQVF